MVYEVPATQKAWLYKEYGPLEDVLTLQDDVKVVDIAADEVLVEVRAASLNPVDIKRLEGYFRNIDSELPHVPGMDVAGVVVKVGGSVAQFKVGDEVYADINENPIVKPKRFGTFAEYVAVEEKLLALKPKNLSFVQAAGLPLAVLTAQEAFDRANFTPGQSALIVGGAGGVGSLAIQLAKHVYGASLVATTASTKKIDLVRSLGADVAYDYTTTNYWELPQKFDFVFDTVGEPAKSAKALKEGGVGGSIVASDDLPANFFIFAVASSGASLAKLTQFIENETVIPVQDPHSPFKFAQLVEALTYLKTGRAIGKVVIISAGKA